MKIIVALQNQLIKDSLDDMYPSKVYIHDIDYMENVIEYLARHKEPYIVITKDTLFGNLDSKMYIKQLRLASPNSKIVYIVENLDEEYKSFLFANEVFNIVEGNNINMEQLKEVIEQDRGVVYRNSIDSENRVSEAAISYNIQNQVIPKQLIAFYGTSGAGKSSISSLIAKKLSTDLKITVSLIDMDLQNPAIDIINEVEGFNNTLSDLVDDVDKRSEINNIIGKYLIKDRYIKNLDYITNNCSIFDCQNRFCNSYYEKIYNSMTNQFDYTIVDLPSSPFLDVVSYTLNSATKIFFVINPNYISIRQAKKYLDLITKLWDISKDKIYIIVNKIGEFSLDITQIQSLISEYRIIASIPFNKNMEASINGGSISSKQEVDMQEIYKALGIANYKSKVISFNKFKSIMKTKFGGVNGN